MEAGPAHSPYGTFCPAPGHHLGFNDLKVIEVAELLAAYDSSGSINGGAAILLGLWLSKHRERLKNDNKRWA